MKKLLRKLRASVSRTFVADCPHCHQHFYGFHKYITQAAVKTTAGATKHYRILCHRCAHLAHNKDVKTV